MTQSHPIVYSEGLYNEYVGKTEEELLSILQDGATDASMKNQIGSILLGRGKQTSTHALRFVVEYCSTSEKIGPLAIQEIEERGEEV